MMRRKHGWLATFLLLALIFSATFALGMALMLGVLIPAYLWLLTDIWQWTPINRWLRFVVLGAIVGVIAGAFFMTHAWLTETRSSMLRRLVTTVAVVTTCIGAVVFAREYLGRVLPG